MFVTTVKNTIMNAIFGGNGGSALPTSYLVGLSTTEPKADGSGITEPSSSAGYGRLPVVFGSANGGTVKNKDVLEFPAFVEDAGVATHYVIYNQDGSPFWFDSLERSRTLEAESVLAFPVGAITISLNDDVVV